ncbi:MAG: hypothetical protein IKJ99_09020 [Oscillospiraceae bacterium]|nr:hypothetical protein [Oscillospiraceae bacterium]
MQKNKLMSMLLSVVIAFGLWLYVVTFVSSEATNTIANIPIALVGETALTERSLMITEIDDDNVNLTLTGSRSDLGKVNNGNITLKVDLTKILDPGVHELEYDISYPGDVSNNAFSVDSKYPATIKITVDKRLPKEVPVQIIYNGSVPEGYLVDRENAVLDYTMISVIGPGSVVELIDHAKIEVDLEDRTESISEVFRYTLCDKEGEPVDVEQVTTNVGEVRMELSIKRFEEIPLVLTPIYGGGAESHTTNISVEPKNIKVSGSEAALADLTEYILGTIDLATITEDTEMTFPITMPEGVTNLSGIDEATVKIKFIGLSMKEFTVSQLDVVNVPAGMDYELLNQALKVTLRGETALINSIEPEDILVTVDLAYKEAGTYTVKATIRVKGDKYAEVGAVGSYSVTVTLTPQESA